MFSGPADFAKIWAFLFLSLFKAIINEEKPKYDYIIVDEFAREARYYEYLDGISTIQRNITFMTKAEDKNLAVACGSIISRYIFLKEFDKICDEIYLLRYIFPVAGFEEKLSYYDGNKRHEE